MCFFLILDELKRNGDERLLYHSIRHGYFQKAKNKNTITTIPKNTVKKIKDPSVVLHEYAFPEVVDHSSDSR